MATLKYVGKAPSNPADLVTESYVQTLGAGSLTQTQVTNRINSGFSPYVLKSYVDTQNALNATPAFVDAGDATRLHLSQIGVPNGVAGLGATGKIPIANVALPNTQRFPLPYISPAAYNASAVVIAGTSSAGAASTLYPVSVADPGFTYKLMIFGQVDVSCSIDGRYPRVWVTQGSTSGQVVAVGAGFAESYSVGITSLFNSAGGFTYQVPAGSGAVDVVVLGGGGGGAGCGFSSGGHGGGAGVYGTKTLVLGTDIASGSPALTGTVGSGGGGGGPNTIGGLGAVGTPGSAGTASTVTYAASTLTGAGGAGGSGTYSGTLAGAAPAALAFDGNTYNASRIYGVGGSGGGFPPNSGLGGGLAGDTGVDGAVWFFAYPTPVTPPRGPAKLVPWPVNAQTPITGATTLYVQMQAATTATPSPTLTASTTSPLLWICPVPA